MIWNVTVVSTLADSYVAVAARESGLVAEQAAERKSVKYIDLQQNHFFQLIAVENLSTSAMEFLNAFGCHISSVSGEDRESAFLFQRISVNIQRFSSVLLHDSLLKTFQSCSHSITFVFNFCF